MKILAVASAGGHWVQLRRMRAAFEGAEVHWMTTVQGYAAEVQGPVHVVIDANLTTKWRLLRLGWQVARALWRIRPDVIVSTGAAPGFCAVVLGRLFGARTVWVDSVANSEQLSAAGARVGRWADVWLTQWPELERPQGPHYWGSVL